jgi:transposase
LKRQSASRLSVRAFCRRERLAESAFYAWRRTVAERDAEAKRSAAMKRPPFVPVLVSGGDRSNGAITLELACGRVLRLPEAIPAGRLAEIVAALEARVAP